MQSSLPFPFPNLPHHPPPSAYQTHSHQSQQYDAPLPPCAVRSRRVAAQLQAEMRHARQLVAQDPLLSQAAAIHSASSAATGQAFEERLVAEQERRVLERHAATEAYWIALKARTAARLGVDESALSLSRSEAWRHRVEEQELLEKARPQEDKVLRETQWAGSLRGVGHSFVPVGNMFSGLWTKIKQRDDDAKVDIVRKVKSRSSSPQRSPSRGWQQNEYLLQHREQNQKHYEKLVRNSVSAQEREAYADDPTFIEGDAVPALDALVIRGTDLLQQPYAAAAQ